MDIQTLAVVLLIGAVAGWLAGLMTKGKGFGILGNIVVGVAGAFIGDYVFKLLGLAATGMIGSIVVATSGAVILLILIRIVFK